MSEIVFNRKQRREIEKQNHIKAEPLPELLRKLKYVIEND